MPKDFHRFKVREKEGDEEDYVYVDSSEGLLMAAQIGALELHIWGSRIEALERPDRIVLDLDPGEGVAFGAVREAAGEMRDAFEAIGLESFVLLTGGKGVHVVAPIRPKRDWSSVKAVARALAEHFTERDPQRYVAAMAKAERGGKIFIDHFRNERAATAIAPFSPRARAGAPLAWPVSWEDLPAVERPNLVTLMNAAQHPIDAWRGYHRVAQDLTQAVLTRLGVKETRE
jgi:bifunctional non-homologous end joining protein LigD